MTRDLLLKAYAAYNTQDVDTLLDLVSADVNWPDDSGNRLQGRAAVRAYWLEQWTRTRTYDEPVAFAERADGRVVVRIKQTVRSVDGSVISTGSYDHVHLILEDHIARLDIVPAIF